MFENVDRFMHDGWWWPGVLMPILFLILIGVGVWAIVRVTARGPVAAGPPPLPPAGEDPALEELRLRYTRGEIDREDFVRRSRDLGGTEPEPGFEATTLPPDGSSRADPTPPDSE